MKRLIFNSLSIQILYSGHTKRRKVTKRHPKRHNTMRIDTNKSRFNVLLVSFRVFLHFSILKCEKTRKDTPRDIIQVTMRIDTNKSRSNVLFRPATHPDLIGISRFFSTNLGVSRFPDSTCENLEFLFSFEIGKTKGRLTLWHGPCLQTHKIWAKNKCYDRLNPLHTATRVK